MKDRSTWFDARERFERIAESLEHAWRLAVRDRALDERISKLIENL